MKKLLLFILIFIPGLLQAQDIPDDISSTVRIISADKTQLAEIIPVSKEPTAKKDLFYYWYATNMIHFTQGGFSGKLLNGLYTEYYPDKNLKQKGNFKAGLKNGIWKSWNENGLLSGISTWVKGVQQPDVKLPFWKKLNIFKRKTKVPATTAPPKSSE